MSGGQGVTTGQGSGTGSTFVGLRSRKVGVSGTERSLSGSVISALQQNLPVVIRPTLVGQSSVVSRGTITSSGPSAPSWNSAPNVVIAEGSTTPVSIGTFVNDYNASTDVITIIAGTLPAGITFTGNQLVPDGSQTEATISGMQYSVSRSGGTGVPSAVATITVIDATLPTWYEAPRLVFPASVARYVRIGEHVSGFNALTDEFRVTSGNPGFLTVFGQDYIEAIGTQSSGVGGANVVHSGVVYGVRRNGGAWVDSPATTVTVIEEALTLTSSFVHGNLQFETSTKTNAGAPDQTNYLFVFGKQNPSLSMQIAGVWQMVHLQGDGANKYNGVTGNYVGGGTTYNDVLAFDPNTIPMSVVQHFNGYGKNIDGTTVTSYSYPVEGGTQAVVSPGVVMITPGFIRNPPGGEPGGTMDPHSVMTANFRKVHYYNLTAKTAVAGNDILTAGWPDEHWGGAHDPTRNRVWIQCTTGGEDNGMKYFTPTAGAESITTVNFSSGNVSALNAISGVPRGLNTQRFVAHIYNDEYITFDPRRGYVVGIALSTLNVRLIGYLGKMKDKSWPDGSSEAVESLEFGIALDAANGVLRVTTQGYEYFDKPEEAFDIGEVNLSTGAVAFTRFPHPNLKLASACDVPLTAGGSRIIVYDTTDSRVSDRFFFYRTATAGVRRHSSLTSTAVHEWRDIPNSTLIENTALSLSIFNAGRANARLPLVTYGGPMPWGANKLGITHTHWEGYNFPGANQVNLYGNTPDQYNRGWWFRAGDVHMPLNGASRFDLDSCTWWIEAVKSCNHLQYRYPDQITGLYPTPIAGDIDVLCQNYDGSPTAQHAYYAPCAFGPRMQYYGYISNQQPAPTDSGGNAKCVVATTTDGLWLPGYAAADRPGWSNDIGDWVMTHPTEPKYVYSYSSTTGHIHRFDSSGARQWAWTQVTASAIPNIFRCSASFDVTNNEILLVGNEHGIGGAPRAAYTVNMSSGAVNAVTLTGANQADITPDKYGGLTYSPDSNKHYFIKHTTGVLYSITRTTSTTFTCVAISTTGVSITGSNFSNIGWGTIKRLAAMPGTNGLVLETDNLQPLRFIGVV